MNLNKQTTFRKQPSFPWARGLLMTGVLLLTLGHVSPQAQAQDLQKLQEQVTRMERQMRVFLSSYRNINLKRSNVSLRKRLADGQLNFLLKDYVRASIILFDAVENNPGNRGIAWYEALFYLAESLYHNRNYISASTHYQTLVKHKKRHYDKALVRLMEIAEKTNRYQWLNNYFNQGASLPPGPLRNKIIYLRAKGLHRQKKFALSQAEFQKIPQGREWPRAQYFLAVIKLQTLNKKQSIPIAIKYLEAAANALNTSSFKQPKLQDIVHISLGRLYLESKKPKKALNFYQKIGRKSHVFDQALYEICWTYIRRAKKRKKHSEIQTEYKRALRSLDLLLAFLKESTFYPKAQLLRSHLLLQLSKYDSAMGNYQKIVKRYSGLSKELDNVNKSWASPIKFFEKLIEEKLDKFSVASVLPKDAVKWMSSEETMKRTLVMLRDLREMSKYLVDSQVIIQKLQSALQVQDRIALTPTLKEGRVRALGMRSQLISIQEKLNSKERSILFPKATASQRQQYKNIQERLKTLQTLFQQTPQNRQEILRRAKSTETRIINMQARLHKLTLQFDYNTRFVTAARNWLATNPEAQKLTPTQRNSISSQISEVTRKNNELERKQQQLKRTLELAQVQFGNVPVGAQDERIQTKYRRLLNRERQVLSQMSSNLSADEQQTVTSIRSQTNRVRSLQKQLRGFFTLLRRLISQYSVRMQKKVREEKLKVNRYEQQVSGLRNRAKRLASRIAYNAFLSARSKIKSLVLRADVGVIDVVWQEKQTTQSKIRKLSKERNSELRVLDSEFKDILQEVK